ncbi:hypothetical protein B0H17DRAFT_1135229 [Mycena rosella]|uniref:Uncharacterized protein n=1 Tax=Mycena rosella TaxID=1033263 RepID=A0AAD7GDF6_MYCRO|nr:hypothetical protein B0H17DRAFT_1135229 [Mycena rosella]
MYDCIVGPSLVRGRSEQACLRTGKPVNLGDLKFSEFPAKHHVSVPDAISNTAAERPTAVSPNKKTAHATNAEESNIFGLAEWLAPVRNGLFRAWAWILVAAQAQAQPNGLQSI